ncbi:MFS transporter [Micromonospora zingiberis]|uniref:MFS transporter n=1 Tax=Micromonospora zingiberis TaxID=2053011 RepID=UPI0013F3FECD|nr:MFS transporter [Micromonospora zingiberis]
MTSTLSSDTRRAPELTVLLIGSTLTVLAGAVLTPVVQLLITERQLTATAAGLVVTVHGISLAVAAPATGHLVDRYGVRRPLAIGLLLYGLAGGAGAIVESYPLLIATRLVFGVGAALVFTGTTVGLLDRYAGPARDRVMGWRSTAISLGGVVWPLIGGVLGVLSWRAPFLVYLLGIPLALLALRLPDEPRPPTAPGPAAGPGAPAGPDAPAGADASTGRAAPAGPDSPAGADASAGLAAPAGSDSPAGADASTGLAAPAGPDGRTAPRRLAVLVTDGRRLLGVYALQFLATMLLYVVLVFLPVRLAELDITNTAVVAAVAASLSLAMSAAGFGYVHLRARLAPPALLRHAFTAWAVALLVLALVDVPVLLLAAPPLFGLGMGLAVPALTVLTADHAPPGRRAQAIALLATAGFTGQFGAPLLFGPLHPASSAGTTFLAAAVLAGAAAVLIVPRPGRRR